MNLPGKVADMLPTGKKDPGPDILRSYRARSREEESTGPTTTGISPSSRSACAGFERERAAKEGEFGKRFLWFLPGWLQTLVALQTGSKARNITDDRSGLSPEDFHVSLHLTWVPPIRAK